MPVPLLDLTAQYATLADELDAAVHEVVRTQRFILGPTVEKFEQEAARYLGARHAIGCASGTDALLLPLRALQLQPGDEVIVPAFTFFATAGAVWNAGLKPVFVDIDPVTYNVRAEDIERAITPRTRAIIPVHLYGQVAEMEDIMALAERHHLAVIEDAAQAFGARRTVGGVERYAGTFGTVGSFSFFPSKNLGGFGDGGLMTTDDDVLADRLRKLRVHGGIQMYHHEMVGTNSRLDALQAAVLSVKLPHLEGWAEGRRRHAAHHDAKLAGVPGVTTPVALPESYHVYNQYTIRAERRAELKKALDERRIGNAIYYPLGLHLQECFKSLGYRPGDLPETERATTEVISLPVYPELTGAQLDEVADAIRTFYC